MTEEQVVENLETTSWADKKYIIVKYVPGKTRVHTISVSCSQI